MDGFKWGSLIQWLAGMAIVAGIGAAFVAYAASGTAGEAKVKADSALEENDTQNLEIRALEMEQKHIKEGVDDNQKMLRALLRAQNIPDPTS